MDPHSTLLRRRAEHVAGPPDAVDTMHILLIDSQKLYGFGKLMYPWRDVSPFCRLLVMESAASRIVSSTRGTQFVSPSRAR